ncbi:MAG: hypothetical protein AMJ73_08915 [candidate division Zixibacteria bacterium SM1_73]|nr:MAG: hypothetical protein AMJ73_08915 [candidate division Zixibacteria bacterium SM1_73]
MRNKNLSEKRRSSLFPWGKGLILFFGLLLFFQCSLRAPTTPTWYTEVTIPLVKKNYDMVALIEKIDEPSLETDSLGNLFFHIEENLDTIRLWGKLVCDSVTKDFKDTLGTIDITSFESKQVIFSVTDFYSGEPGIVPPISASIEADLDTFTSFDQVTLQEGHATLIAFNHLGLNLDWLKLDIIDRGSSEILETLIIPGGIRDNDSIIQKLTFVDKTFSNRFAIQVSAHTPGGFLSSLEDKYFSLDFSIDSLMVTQGMAKIPSFDLTTDEEIILPSDHIIDSAKVRTGSLFLDLYNFSNVTAEITIDFPEVKKNGEILKANCVIPAEGHCNLGLSLDGYSLKPLSGISIEVQIRMQVKDSGDQLVFFSSSDSVTASAFLSEIAFSQISGKLEPTVVDIDEIRRDLNLPPGFEHAHIKSASLNLDIHNGVDFPGSLSATVEGDKGQRLELSGEIEPGTPWATAVTSIQEDNLDPLLDPIPEKLTVTGQVICGDGVYSGTANEEDFFFGEIKIASPLELILDSCQVEIEQDTHSINDDVKSLIEDQINSSQVIFKIESHLPLEARASVFVSKNEENIFSHPDLVIGPVYVPKGKLDQNGVVTESKFSEDTISLNYEELQIFRVSPFYVAGVLNFPGTGGSAVKALATDFIRINSYLELEVKNKKD